MIIGIDASERALGLVAIPAAWDIDEWHAVIAQTLPAGTGGPSQLRRSLAKQVVTFCRAVNPTRVYIEDYPRHGAFNIGRLAELHGVLKDHVEFEFGVSVEPVNMSSARKLLLGKLPRGKGMAKKAVLESLRSVWIPGIDDAQADAFTVANFGRSQLGLWAVSGAAA